MKEFLSWEFFSVPLTSATPDSLPNNGLDISSTSGGYQINTTKGNTNKENADLFPENLLQNVVATKIEIYSEFQLSNIGMNLIDLNSFQSASYIPNSTGFSNNNYIYPSSKLYNTYNDPRNEIYYQAIIYKPLVPAYYDFESDVLTYTNPDLLTIKGIGYVWTRSTIKVTWYKE